MAGQFIVTAATEEQVGQVVREKFIKTLDVPRIPMVGRSNVGKSTLINQLLGQRLAQVSKEPGKTRAIHFYFWKDQGFIFADLPGYGFAKVGGEERNRWGRVVQSYLSRDPKIGTVLVLLDSRVGPTESDRNAILFLGSCGVPMTFVFTKADKLKTQSERALRKRKAQKDLEELGYSVENVLWVSSTDVNGLKSLRQLLRDLKV